MVAQFRLNASPNMLNICQKKAFISNSGTLTSCFADFIKLPSPAFRASTSPSFNSSSIRVGDAGLPFSVSLGAGEAPRVGGAVVTSISIKIEDLRRRAGSRAKRADTGLGGGREEGPSGIVTDGLSNDQVRTRSNAKA